MRRALPCAVLVLAASCTSHKGYYSSSDGNGTAPTGPSGSSGTGTIVGTITSSLGGALSGVHVVVTPSGGTAMAAVTTTASGGFAEPGVTISPNAGAVTVSALPTNCTAPATSSYTGLTAGDTVTVNITVVCSGLVGAVRGTVTSSLGGGLAGVGVIVTPHNGTALTAVATSATGAFVVGNVPIADSTGAVTLVNVPTNCTAPASATNYAGLGFGDTVTVGITVTCTSPPPTGGTGTVSGTVTSSVGGPLSGVQVMVTPTGGAALAAVTTSGAGVYSVSHVPIGAGTVTISGGLPAQCSAPSGVSYSGLTNNGSATANIVAPCQLLGSLTVQLIPSPGLGTVTVTGPGNYVQTMTQTTALTNLVPGSYTVTASSYGIPGTFAATMYDGVVTGSPATVTAGGTSNVSVSYGARGGSGAMWVFTSSSPGRWRTIPNSELGASGNVAVGGTMAFNMSDFNWANAAVDVNGVMWFAPGTGDGLYGLTPTALGAGNLSTTSITLTHILEADPTALAFDASGNLWVTGTAISGTELVTESFTPAALAAGGQQFASQIMELSGTSSSNAVLSMTFGPHGDLWMANLDQTPYTSTLQAFTAAQLAAGGPQAPMTTLTLGDLANGMAFDQNWNLWVSLNNTGKVVMFTQSQLAAGGTQTPAVTLSGFLYPAGLAFDASGDLWVMTSGKAVGFNPFQLTTSGTPSPAVTVTFTGAYAPSIIVFDPHSGSLPLNGSRVIPHPNAKATTTRRHR